MCPTGPAGEGEAVPDSNGPGQSALPPGTEEDIIVLPPDDERAQRIGRAVSSPTARGILRQLSSGPATASGIAESLHASLNKTTYHIGQLLDAGLLEVVSTQYSVKGRECKLYGLKERIFVVAPRHIDVKALLLRYTALFGAVCAVSALIYILPLLLPPERPLLTGGGVPSAASGTVVDPVLAFCLGGVFVVTLLLVLEINSWRRKPPADEEEE